MDSLRTASVPPAQAAAPPGDRQARRLRGILIAAPCWGMLVLASVLSPHASGTGTHQDLGLPICSFQARTGLPCPTCGLTTSVSAIAHGRIALAWRAHPFGVFLFIGVLALALTATADALTGSRWRWRRPAVWLAWGALLGIPAGWAAKLILGLADGTLPMR